MSIPDQFDPYVGQGNPSFPYSPAHVTPYGNQFMDIASTRMPRSVKQLFMLSEYYAFLTPVIAGALNKKASYPITSLVYDTDNEPIMTRWQEILEEVMELPENLIMANLNYFVYGNCFVSIHRPIKKFVVCKTCGLRTEFSKLQKIKIFRGKFTVEQCPQCNTPTPELEVIDNYLKDLDRMKLVFWDPNRMGIIYTPFTGDRQYTFDIPEEERKKIRSLEYTVEELSKIEQVYIDAALSEDRKVAKFKRNAIFHMKAPSIAGFDPAWGYPVVMSAIKEAYYSQVLKKANEAIMMGHIVPLKYLYPAPNAPGIDIPWGGMNLKAWKSQVLNDLARWKRDPNYIPVFPLPLGQGNFGGEGKSLLTNAELDFLNKTILAGMGVPQEFVYGGLQWSGSNVSLRMLENEFLSLRKQSMKLVKFIIKSISQNLGISPIDVHFSEFKMADDAQRKQFFMQLFQQQSISLDTLLDEFGLDYRKELDKRMQEAKEVAEMQKKEQLEQIKTSAEVQKAQQEVSIMLQKKMEESGMATGPDGQPMTAGQPGQPDNASGSPQAGAEAINQGISKETANSPSPTSNPENRPPRGPNSQI